MQSPSDNGSRYFLRAQYDPSSDTGNAINEPIDSNVGIVTVAPLVEIVAEPPEVRQISVNDTTTFSVTAGLTDESYGTVSYQWQLNGENVDDGVITTTTTTSTSVETNVDETFTEDGSIVLNNARNVVIVSAGAKGGTGGSDAGGNGAPGFRGRAGRLGYIDGSRTLTFSIGKRGNGGSSGNQSAGGNGGAGNTPQGAGGGGGAAGGSGDAVSQKLDEMLADANIGEDLIESLGAGLRSFDKNMPEELNRRLIDHSSDLLLCPTSNSVTPLPRDLMMPLTSYPGVNGNGGLG